MIDGYHNDDKALRIIQAVEARYLARSPLLKEMLEVQMRYDGNTVVTPLPEVDGTPSLPKTTPLLIANAIDSVALAASSVMPMLQAPALDSTKATGTRSREFARIRRQGVYAIHRKNHMNLLLRRAHRQFGGYATWAMVVMPGEDGPVISLREPLGTYPDPKAPEDPSPPKDVAFVYTKSASWLRYTYPALKEENGGPIPREPKPHTEQWLMFEWLDCDETVIGLMGPQGLDTETGYRLLNGRPWRIISWDVNPLDYVPAVIPRRVSMSRIASQVSQLVGQADLMDKLMALDIAAQEKAIFPDRYIVSAEGRNARLDDPAGWKDGRTGKTNIIHDAASIGELVSRTSPSTQVLLDRLEANFQQSMGLMPQLQGVDNSRMRSGRQMDQLYGISIDPRVQEVHEVTEAALTYVNMAIVDICKAYWPSKKYTLLAGRKSATTFVEFEPAKHFETNQVAAAYAIPGATAEQLTIALGQAVQAGLMSAETARSLHPWIDDPEQESMMAMVEALDEAMLQGTIRALVTSTEPGFSPAMIYAARIQELVRQGSTLADAMRTADEEARQAQAQQLPPEAPPMPQAMPGIAGMPQPMGGMAPPQAPMPMPVPPPQEGMGQMLAALGAQPGMVA